MKKLSLQKIFLQKILQKLLQKMLLLMVLFLGGCQLEFRKGFDIPDPSNNSDAEFIGNISEKQFELVSGIGVDGLITFGKDTDYYNGSLYFTGDAPYRHLAFKAAESPTSASYLSYQEDNTTRTYKVSIDGDSLIVVDDEDNESKYTMSDSTATTRVAMSKNIFEAMWNASGSTLEHGNDITLYGDDGYQATAFVGVSDNNVLSATYTYDINKSKYDNNIKDTSNVATSSAYTDIKDYIGAIVHQGLYVGDYEYIRISGTDYKLEISEDGLSLVADDGSVYRTYAMSDVTVSKNEMFSFITFTLNATYTTGSTTITVEYKISLGYGFAGNKISIDTIMLGAS